jgi:hypothetical protein
MKTKTIKNQETARLFYYFISTLGLSYGLVGILMIN